MNGQKVTVKGKKLFALSSFMRSSAKRRQKKKRTPENAQTGLSVSAVLRQNRSLRVFRREIPTETKKNLKNGQAALKGHQHGPKSLLAHRWLPLYKGQWAGPLRTPPMKVLGQLGREGRARRHQSASAGVLGSRPVVLKPPVSAAFSAIFIIL